MDLDPLMGRLSMVTDRHQGLLQDHPFTQVAADRGPLQGHPFIRVAADPLALLDLPTLGEADHLLGLQVHQDMEADTQHQLLTTGL